MKTVTPTNHASQSGFTLIELMMVIVIMSIVMALGAPAFLEMRRNSAMSETTNKLIGAFRYARAEAVRTGETHVVGASTNKDKPDNVLIPKAFAAGVKNAPDYFIATWKNSDLTSTYAFDSADGDELVRIQNLVKQGTHLTSSVGNLVTIAFLPNGTVVDNAGVLDLDNGATITIGICDDRKNEVGRNLTILPSGVVALNDKDDC